MRFGIRRVEILPQRVKVQALADGKVYERWYSAPRDLQYAWVIQSVDTTLECDFQRLPVSRSSGASGAAFWIVAEIGGRYGEQDTTWGVRPFASLGLELSLTRWLELQVLKLSYPAAMEAGIRVKLRI